MNWLESMNLLKDAKSRRLILTMTNEPFQPVRIYYLIPDRSFVTRKLQSLRCMIEVPHEQCWQWQYKAEAASLRFPGSYDDVPKEKRPIVLGWFRFPEDGRMVLQINSIARAIEGARFFGPHFGPYIGFAHRVGFPSRQTHIGRQVIGAGMNQLSSSHPG
jgi:hypothetical protein